jgi:hypothetical protein
MVFVLQELVEAAHHSTYPGAHSGVPVPGYWRIHSPKSHRQSKSEERSASTNTAEVSKSSRRGTGYPEESNAWSGGEKQFNAI